MQVSAEATVPLTELIDSKLEGVRKDFSIALQTHAGSCIGVSMARDIERTMKALKWIGAAFGVGTIITFLNIIYQIVKGL